MEGRLFGEFLHDMRIVQRFADLSRWAAFASPSMETYRAQMRGVYTTCVAPDTLDESPMAYRSMDEIAAGIAPTADVAERIRPVYNFKAAE